MVTLLAELAPLLRNGGTVFDGGNTSYRDDVRGAAELQTRGIHHVDVGTGTGGGVAGLGRSYCLMIGGAEYCRFEMNLPEIAEVWRRSSVIGSWLLDLTARAFLKDPELERYAGQVSDSGEGRWTLQAAIDEGVPVPVLSAALFERLSSRGGSDFANRVLSALREEFGGHAEWSAP